MPRPRRDLVLASTLSVLLGCNLSTAGPAVADVAGKWRLTYPEHWLEKSAPRVIELDLQADGTFFEMERWGGGVETSTGRWTIQRTGHDVQLVFVGQNDNGSSISFARPLFRRSNRWVPGIDGGPDLGNVYFERVSSSGP